MLKKLLASGVALAALSGAAQAADKTLVISVYGFAQDAFKEIVYDPFEAKCGCELVVETGNSVERLAKLEARKDDPEIDMAVMSTHDALSAARKGITQSIDVSRLSNYDKLYEIAKDPVGDNMGVGYTFYATSIAYRADEVTIESWADLFQDKLKGRVAFPNVSTNQGPPALYMVGKAIGDDAADLKAAIGEVAKNKVDIVTFYERSSQVAQLMQQEEILAAPIGRFAWGAYSKMGFDMAWATPKEGQTGGMNVMILTKGAKNEDLAYQFMDFWLSTEIQTKLAEALVDSPANAEVKVSDDIAENLTYGAETVESLKLLDPAVILDNRESWLSEWNAQIGQ
ncbi:polyamine ABC transporter substrate-binding protein [Nitratireductor kimnyeongensis]|uniref:Polyamine ABC transporter substrate-binding protein n=1 Tax=Nitratireductor kimnyeongensis TaxID=430679 RepID=A0ABW0T848_9HYPH|nr:ABC transporter substrate-binding protein [Nitratireductor kimnyeongensis]QZZ36426.1 polyamine ABC transporter substrate-binding protein [Nitratireductor kimnyeongensis]